MSAGPLTSILGAFSGGATSLADVERRTGLDREVVRAGVDHLVRTGRLEAKQLTSGCPIGGCGSCASADLHGGAGCGAAGPSARRSGPVLVSLGIPRRDQRGD